MPGLLREDELDEILDLRHVVRRIRLDDLVFPETVKAIDRWTER
jgi:hypothetical protein